MEELKKQLIELENQLQNLEKINPSVSNASVGWHIEHSLLVINLTIESIEKSNPEKYKKSFNFNRLVVFTISKIPRGKVKAPKAVQPSEDFTINSLKKHLENSKENLEKLNTLSLNKYFDHPFMGHLKLKKTIRFIMLHTQHHISIIRDIIKS